MTPYDELLQGNPWAIGPQDMGRPPMMGAPGALQMGMPPPALDSRMIPQAPAPGPLGAQQRPQFTPPWMPGQPGPSPIAQAQQQWAQRLREQYKAPQKQGWGAMLGSALLPALVGKLAGGSGRDALLYGIGSAAQNFTTQLGQYRDVEAQIAAAEANLPMAEAKYGADMASAYKNIYSPGGATKVNSVIKTGEGYKLVMSNGDIMPTNEDIFVPPTKAQMPNYERAVIEDPDNPGQYVQAMVNKRNPTDVRIIGKARPTPTDVKAQMGAVNELAQIPETLRALEENTSAVTGAIDDAITMVGWDTAGVVGGSETAKGMWQPSADLAQMLSTIQANAAFDRLQEMRNASKTGGALGQVSERELMMLQNARAALGQTQGPEQLKKNLKNLRDRYERALKALREDTKFQEWLARQRAGGAPPAATMPAPGVSAGGSPQIPQQAPAPQAPAPQAGPQWSIVDPQTPGAPAARANNYLNRVR